MSPTHILLCPSDVVNATNDTCQHLIRGWMENPSCGRGTLTLLYSCFFTIILCTWTAAHPDVPDDSADRWDVFNTKFWKMVWGICAPEYIALCALVEFLDARHIRNELREMQQSLEHRSMVTPMNEDETPAPTPGSRSASAASFPLLPVPLVPSENNQRKTKYGMVHGFMVVMKGVEVQDEPGKMPKRMTTETFMNALYEGTIGLPDIDASVIEDRSKGDSLTKTLACIQVLYMSAQIIGRAAQGLSISTLEVFTAGVIICSLPTYCVWWFKPLDVHHPILTMTKKDSDDNQVPGQRKFKATTIRDTPVVVFGLIVTCLFGAVHILAWQFFFPSKWEMRFWRLSSICCVVLPLLVGVYGCIVHSMPSQVRPFSDRFNAIVIWLYVTVRLNLFIETFSSLRMVPATVYDPVDWTRYFPHI